MSVDEKTARDYVTLEDPVCETCTGTGSIGQQRCGTCGGAGRVKAGKKKRDD